MKVPEVGAGVCFGVGGTSYRVGEIDKQGNVVDSYTVPTPDNPKEFFDQTLEVLLDAANRGATYAVLGVPGPVKVDVDEHDRVFQNFRITNVPALSRTEGFDPVGEMIHGNMPAQSLFNSDFTFLTVNDSDLAAQAAAKLYGDTRPIDGLRPRTYNVVADLINGTGVGGAIVRHDPRFFPDVYHPDQGLWEIGHNGLTHLGSPEQTYERAVSGPALEERTGKSIKELDQSGDKIWQEVAHDMGNLALLFAINGGAQLVVVSGGNAIKAQRHIKDEMQRMLNKFAESSNPMADKVPDLRFVPRDLEDTYEMYGARGAVVSHLARRAVNRLVRAVQVA